MWSHPFLLGKEGKKVREEDRRKLAWTKEGQWRIQCGGMGAGRKETGMKTKKGVGQSKAGLTPWFVS